MKNIHILPTDKPSRLFEIIQFNLSFDKTNYFSEDYKILHKYKNKHIYITSDEEIKEGDWFTDNNNSLKRSYKLSHVQFANPKKIILTTDQNLIKDGVQAIDDEFLEWFVKNPSCEEVEIKNRWEFLGDDYRRGGEQTLVYKIIIPKEEPLYNYGWCKGNVVLPKEEPKQETLEEAAKECLRNNILPTDGDFAEGYITGSMFGAKWQQEQDKNKFSEEEVLQIIKNAFNQGERYGWDTRDSIGNINEMRSKIPFISLEKYLETFKNK